MNRSQFAVLLMSLALVVVALTYRPYYVDGLFGGIIYRLPVDRPEDGVYEPDRLRFEFFVIALFAATFVAAAREGGGRADRFVLRAGLLANASLLYYFVPQLNCIFSDACLIGGSLLISILSIITLTIASLTRAPVTSARLLRQRPGREQTNE